MSHAPISGNEDPQPGWWLFRRSPTLAYLVAIFGALFVVVPRLAIDGTLGDQLTALTYILVVLSAGLVGGWKPGLLATGLSILAALFFLIEPAYSFKVDRPTDVFRLVAYAAVGLAISMLCEGLQRAWRRLEDRQRRLTLEVAERAKAERAVQVAAHHMKIVTDSMSAPVTRCSRDFKYLWVSNAYAEWLGRKPEKIVGRPIAEILGRTAFEQIKPFCERALAGEEVDYEIEIEYRGFGLRWIHAIYSPTFDSNGQTDGWVAVVLDIGERKRAEQVLLEADRRKDEFLATLAHELRNPLAPICNAMELLKLKNGEDADAKAVHDVVDRQLRQMTRLIDDLLDVSRISRNALRLQKERVELATIVQNAVEAVTSMFEASGHKLAIDLPTEPLVLEADTTRIAQVVSNLLNNAAKYTDAGGRISVSARREGSDAVIAVRDNGIGIPREMLSKIFEMFEQVDDSLERSQAGLGIGLTLVRQLVVLHGGSVEAHSEGPGRGSEFLVRLPALATAPKIEPRRDNGNSIAKPLGNARILVVDDNKDSAQTMATLLKIMGGDVRTAFDGPSALEAASAFQPEVAVLDIGLPEMNGYELCRRIRDQSWGKSMFIIALTGWGQDEDRNKSREAGFDHHLVKPADHAALTQLIAGRADASRNQNVEV